MRNLLKPTLGMLAVTAAAGAFASVASASPTLSPVPEQCGSCESTPTVPFSLSSGRASWHVAGESEFAYNRTSGAGEFEPTSEGTKAFASPLTFEEGLCVTEGGNFAARNLAGRLGVIGENGEGVGVLLGPETGSVFGKCTQSGAPAEITGAVIGELGPTNTRTTNFTLGYKQSSGTQAIQKLNGEEASHQLSIAYNGGKPSHLGWEATESMTTPEPVELRTTGGTATFVKQTYGGRFNVTGGAMKLLSKNGLEIKCKAVSGTGTFTSATGGNATLSFTGCKGPLLVKCNDATTTQLSVQLVYTYPATETPEGRQTAVLLSPKTGGVFNEFICPGTKVNSVVTGSVLAVISPLAKPSSTFALTLKQSGGEEVYKKYEGAGGEADEAILQDSIEGGKPEISGLEANSPTINLDDGGVETIK